MLVIHQELNGRNIAQTASTMPTESVINIIMLTEVMCGYFSVI